jgi:hypothetical protein
MPTSKTLLSGAKTVSSGLGALEIPARKTFQANLDGAGATATVVFEGSNTGDLFLPLGLVTLTSAAPTDGLFHNAPWTYVRASVTAISGGGSVSATIGY